jgi:hypothetical protein
MGSPNTPDGIPNALLLRTDLHIAFDKPKLDFMPKPSSVPEHPQLVTHLLEASAELEYLYHNRALQSLRSSIQMLFARFAWTVFLLLDGFWTCREPRRLLPANGVVEDSADGNGFVSWEKYVQRLRSLKKRRPDAEAANDHEAGNAVEMKEILRLQKRSPASHHIDKNRMDRSCHLCKMLFIFREAGTDARNWTEGPSCSRCRHIRKGCNRISTAKYSCGFHMAVEAALWQRTPLTDLQALSYALGWSK